MFSWTLVGSSKWPCVLLENSDTENFCKSIKFEIKYYEKFHCRFCKISLHYQTVIDKRLTIFHQLFRWTLAGPLKCLINKMTGLQDHLRVWEIPWIPCVLHKLTGRKKKHILGIACFSLNQLKLLSMALELMLSVLASSAISLEIILSIDYFKSMRMHITKGYAETFLHLRKWLTKSTRINQSMRLPLRYTLQYWNSEANIANTRWHPGFLAHPI